MAEHVADVIPASSIGSYSGDIHLVRSRSSSNVERALTFTARFRSVNRIYGGDAVTDLGSTSIYHIPNLPEPPVELFDQNQDRVRQTSIGVNYGQRWRGHGSFSAGILSTYYRRALDIPGVSSSPEHTLRTLPTVSFSANLSESVLLYGSYTRGLEDSTPAPSSARNRGEPAPATPTSQMDAGIRVTLKPHLEWIAGVFKIEKSYFNLDQSSQYLELGHVSARGIETSVNWTGPKGLTIVGGACWLRPEVSRRVAELGGEGSTPVGPIPRTINVNVDYAPSSWKGLGTSAQWNSFSSRVETSNNNYRLPPYTTLNLAARYNRSVFNHSYSARLEADNVFDRNAVTLSTTYFASSQPGRSYVVTLTADF